MPKQHGAREQKKLAKQKAKRNARRRELARSSSPNPAVRLKAAHLWPVVASLVPENLWSEGLGQLVFARRMPDGNLACAVFLVDAFCLGVKNAMWRILSPGEFKTLRERIEESGGRLELVKPEYFSKLVHLAVDYGQSLGFAPHPDFRAARLLLEGIDPSLSLAEFQFGKDGKPFYIRGPHESISEARSITKRVDALGGHYFIPMSELEASAELDTIDAAWQPIDEEDH